MKSFFSLVKEDVRVFHRDLLEVPVIFSNGFKSLVRFFARKAKNNQM